MFKPTGWEVYRNPVSLLNIQTLLLACKKPGFLKVATSRCYSEGMGSDFELIDDLTEPNIQFAICIVSEEDGDLEIWKVYRTLPDPKAVEVGCLRVIDESGEDYLYPANRFVVVDFPEDIRARLLAVAGQ